MVKGVLHDGWHTPAAVALDAATGVDLVAQRT